MSSFQSYLEHCKWTRLQHCWIFLHGNTLPQWKKQTVEIQQKYVRFEWKCEIICRSSKFYKSDLLILLCIFQNNQWIDFFLFLLYSKSIHCTCSQLAFIYPFYFNSVYHFISWWTFWKITYSLMTLCKLEIRWDYDTETRL